MAKVTCAYISSRYIIRASFFLAGKDSPEVNVKDLCLGALSFGDASGYDLKKFFESSFRHFCAAGYGSIYPALAELTDEGLVSCHEETQPGKPGRKLYQLTDAGRKSFLKSLEKTSPEYKVKSDFLLALYFTHLLPPEHLQSLLDGRIAELNRQINQIEQAEDDADAPCKSTIGKQFVSGFGLTVMTAARDYLRAHRHKLITGVQTAVLHHSKSTIRNARQSSGITHS
ncbi:MAG: helix-turn-helix transcriptional regulator [Gammaproteobacteria bacterium]